MATELGEVTSYKRLYMQFRDSAAKIINITLNNPKNLEDGDYADFAAQDAAIEGVMDTIIAKNIFLGGLRGPSRGERPVCVLTRTGRKE